MIYRFGAFELDEARGELRRDGKAVAIQPKPLALLGLLIRERERVVPADEILATLWPDTVVTPGSLNRAVSHARRAIGDTHKGRFIRSISRRGYRFGGEVTVADPGRPAGRAAQAPAAERPFVGRGDALARIRAAWARAAAERAGAVVLVSGPPGIGKTRLTERATQEIEAAGALVLVGRAREGEGVPAFWPFAQALRRLLEQPAAADALREVASHEPELAELLGLSAAAAPARAPEQGRFLLFDAVCRALLREARRRPLLLLLEDVQWAGVESLRLLEHLAHEPLDAPLLVLATVRDEPRAPGHPVERALGLLRAQDRCTEVALQPFSRAEVGALLEQVLAKPAPPELTSELFARTEGVPLFLREALRLLAERGALAEPERVPREGVVLPARALDLIRRPLERLSPAATALVSAAAVLGRDFELTAAAAVADQERAAALDCVDEAVAAGVLEATGATAFRFTHALFQEAALAALAPGARARLHLRAAEHLERENAGDASALLVELAHHRHRALAVGDPERACDAALRAAAQCVRRGAWEQAALHTEQAREAFEQVPGCDPERRLALALDATDAWRFASERSRRRQSAQAAFELARALGKPRELARAAIGMLDLQEWAVRDEAARATIEEALAAVRGTGGVEEARLVTRLAYLEIRIAHENAARRARQAVELARGAGDPDALQDALYTLHFAIGGPDGLAERSSIAAEIETVAPASRSADRALIALLDTAGDRFELGDRPGGLRLREAARRIAGARPHLGMRWHLEVYDTGIALLEGRLDEVAARVDAAYSVGLRAEHPYARACANGHRALLARERGDAAGVLAALAPALRAREGPGQWVEALVARAEHASGRTREARARFEALAARGFADVPRNLRWTATLIELSHLCAELEDGARAGALAALLSPYADHHGILPLAICYGGPASWALARLAALRGMRREARALYAEAVAACEAIGAETTRLRIAREAVEGRAAAS